MSKLSPVGKLTTALLCSIMSCSGFAEGFSSDSADPGNSRSFLTTANFSDDIGSSFNGFSKIDMDSLFNGIDASADSYQYVGENIVARGHVVIRMEGVQLSADQVVININSKDIEAAGNITLTQKQTVTKTVSLDDYELLAEDSTKEIKVRRYLTMPDGSKIVEIAQTGVSGTIRAERIAGNMLSGTLKFQNMAMKSGALYVAASEGSRTQDGTITVSNVRLTTCDYAIDDHDHYAFTASTAVIRPRSFGSGLKNYAVDHSEHSVLAMNPILRFWDVPVLWFPALYKPRETDSFGVDLAFGASSDWGFWVRSSKKLTLYDDPYVDVGVMVDYYSYRGMAGGATATVVTDDSRTEFFGYGIYDRHPYTSWDITDKKTEEWYQEKLRLDIPRKRYDFKLNNLTHITPRMDFRGQIEFISDINFLQDYFNNRYKKDVQPPTYAALEYQFDRASAAILSTFRVNSFDSVVERLPEGRLDFQRQELFGGLYYQGENSIGYYRNKWRDFDKETIYGKLKDYSSARFDTLHMFYYPLALDFINIVPRAGVRLTAYSSTSENEVSDDELMAMFRANAADSGIYGIKPFTNFDDSGSAKVRFMGEIGVEANTKIYRSWQDVRSSWLKLDGLRHVMVPYINYTYIPKPTLDADNILYFDDVDRLQEQNFFRLGMVNRLQTREGMYGAERIREWLSLENYWDFNMIRRDGNNNIGNFGTKLKLTPFNGLSLESNLLWDVGQNGDHDTQVKRGGTDSGRPGLAQLKYIDEWKTTLTWQPARDWKFRASYIYSDNYNLRNPYSMGSMIDAMNATSTSLNVNYPMSQDFIFSVDFPTYIDKRMTAGFYMDYDVNAALMKTIAVRIVRNFHCFNIGCELGRSTKRNSDQKKEDSYYVSGYVSLSSMPAAQFSSKAGF